MASKQLFQNDPRWENSVMGFGSTETIGKLGCLLTSLAMIGNHFGGNETVATFNEKMKQNKGFQGAWVKTFRINTVFPNVNYQNRIECDNQDAPLEEIDAALEAGSLVTVRVDYSPSAGIQSHWVVLHQKDGDDYQMWDPFNSPEKPPTLLGRFGFAGTAAQIIQEIIFFGQGDLPDDKPTKTSSSSKATSSSSTAQTAVPTSTTSEASSTSTETDALIVAPTVNGLTLRDEPRISGSNVSKYLPQSSKLVVLDDASEAKTKIGKRNNWLNVRDIEGNQGYVAAWYVTAVDDPALGSYETSEANEPSAPTKLVVKTSASSVSLRTEPRVANSTLITYLPFGTELLVIEDDSAASKIGQKNQWLNVQTVTGRKGYIAAWFVQKV